MAYFIFFFTFEKVSHWHDILPQCKERLKSVAIDERSLPFAVSIYEVVGLREQYLKDISGKTDSPSNFHLRISLFDHEFGLFFGKTWKTPSKNYKGYNSINFNKTAFFHSSINREHILLVLELVALWKNDEEHDFEVSCGWGACLAFKSDVCNTEFGSSKKSANILQIDFYPGTPRCLFYVKDFKDFQTDHQPNKFSASISTQLHPHMRPCLHLIPDNVFFSEVDDVPGISGTGLKRPKLRPALRSSLEKIEIRLLPSLEEFEETFKRLICEDVLKNLDGPFSHEDIVITRRTLRVGVHNGITFVGPLEDIQMSLNSDVLIKKVSRKLSTKSSLQKKNVLTVATALLQGSRMDVGDDEMNSLVHNTRVEIDGMLKDVNFHFIFALIYEITLPTSDGNDDSAKNRLASIAQPVMEILVRWGVLGPQSQEGMEPGYQEIILLGGPRINPFGDMIYTSNPPIFNENMSGNAVKGNSEVLSFKLHLSEGEDLPPFPSPPSHVVQTPPQFSKDSTIQEKYIKPVLVSPEKKDDDEEDLREFPSKQGDAKLQRDSDKPEMMTEVQTTSTELKELPYFPVQVPILPAFPASKRDLTGNGLSRAAFAQLLTLNFPIVLAANGNPAEVVDPSNLIGQMFLEKEYDDQLKFNEITFQFMAFNRLPMTSGYDSISSPCTLFFTFQFYRFDLITSERLMLETVDKEVSQNNSEMLYVLRKIGGDGSMVDGPPGYQVKFIVDAATVGQAEGRDFYKYLNEQLLHIDVWDADSLFHVGECLLDLKVLLRQGKSAVQSTVELDIWHTEYIEPEMVVTDAVVVKEAVAKPIEIMTSLRGKLLMRTGNVGKKISPSTVDGFKGEFLKKRKESSVTYLSKMIRRSRANRLTEVSLELLQMIAGQKQRLSGSSELMNMCDNVERMKKMRRMEALKKKLMNEDMGDESFPIASLRSETESRQRDLQTVEMYRQNIKPENIKNILNQHITTNIIIKTSLGTTSFFEFPLQNPHNIEAVVLIEWIDPDLSLITNASEWRHFKTINNITTPLEEGMFTTPPTQESNDEDSRVVELFLRPKESVHIPFKFLTFRHPIQFHPSRSDFATSSMLTLDTLVKDDVTAAADDDDEKNTCNDILEQGSNNRNIKINFRIKRDMSMLAILDLTVNQQPHIINQIFRLTQPEQTFLKKSFRLPQWPQLTGSQNQSRGNQVFVRCSDPNVICSSSRVAPGNPIDVLIKVACGSAPQVKNFFIAIFTDPRLSKPIQIWQIHVRVMQRVDIAAVQGQTARFSLMIRGSLASRLVRCYSSHPKQMSLNPEEPFMLLAGNLQQINVGIRPIKVGVSSMFVNIVDIESHQLVTSWLIHVITQEPIISRQFEINLTIGGPGENKRISFINPYGYHKNFYVHTSHEHLLLFKDNKLELGPTQKGQIGMKFLSSSKPGRVTILVFINDEEDKNEETFAVKVNFKR